MPYILHNSAMYNSGLTFKEVDKCIKMIKWSKLVIGTPAMSQFRQGTAKGLYTIFHTQNLL